MQHAPDSQSAASLFPPWYSCPPPQLQVAKYKFGCMSDARSRLEATTFTLHLRHLDLQALPFGVKHLRIVGQ